MITAVSQPLVLTQTHRHRHTHLQTVTKHQCLLEQGPLNILRQRQALFTQYTLSWARLSLAVTRLTDGEIDGGGVIAGCFPTPPRWETSSMHHQTCLILLLPWLVKWIKLLNQSNAELLPCKSFLVSWFVLCNTGENMTMEGFGFSPCCKLSSPRQYEWHWAGVKEV